MHILIFVTKNSNVSQLTLIIEDFDIDLEIISYEESIFIAHKLQRAYEQVNQPIALELSMTLLIMAAERHQEPNPGPDGQAPLITH